MKISAELSADISRAIAQCYDDAYRCCNGDRAKIANFLLDYVDPRTPAARREWAGLPNSEALAAISARF